MLYEYNLGNYRIRAVYTLLTAERFSNKNVNCPNPGYLSITYEAIEVMPYDLISGYKV